MPQNLSDQIAAFSREKEALKPELHAALISSEASNAEVVHTFFLTALAEQQAPRFATLESRAETIRRQLAQLPPRSTPNLTPHLPPALAAQLVTYQNQRDELRRNSRRDLRALRSRLPPGIGVELAASGDPPRLLLKTSNPTFTPELLALRTAVDGFNRDYATNAAALNRELAELRRLIAEVPNPDAALPGGKSINDLMRDFTTAALRQASAETYRDYRAAVFEPGLSPEQRRLLFERAGEKMAAVVLEF